MKIQKIDAVKTQLITAIELFFNNGDPVSIHTLVGAARGIICFLNKDSREVYSGIGSNIKPEMRKKFFDMINKSQNFFKHADQDASAELDFDPSITEYHLYDAIWLYAPLVNGNITKEMRIFNFYFSVKNRHLIEPEILKKIDTSTINNISMSNKKDFWKQISIIDSIVSKN